MRRSSLPALRSRWSNQAELGAAPEHHQAWPKKPRKEAGVYTNDQEFRLFLSRSHLAALRLLLAQCSELQAIAGPAAGLSPSSEAGTQPTELVLQLQRLWTEKTPEEEAGNQQPGSGRPAGSEAVRGTHCCRRAQLVIAGIPGAPQSNGEHRDKGYFLRQVTNHV